MRTLINGQYYQITDDAEIIYIKGKIIRISDDNYGNWGIIYRNKFIALSVFLVDDVVWYFANHEQELKIRELAQEILPARGLKVSDIEWFKTVALSDCDYTEEYVAYYKIKGEERYHSALRQACSEQEIIDLLKIKSIESESQEENYCIKGDNDTTYIGHYSDGFTMYLHIEEDNESNRAEAMGKRGDYVPEDALEIYCYRGWLFYRNSCAGNYKIDYFNGHEYYDTLADMERLIRIAQSRSQS